MLSFVLHMHRRARTNCCPDGPHRHYHRCRSRLVGGAEALSGCGTIYSNNVSVFQSNEIANPEIEPDADYGSGGAKPSSSRLRRSRVAPPPVRNRVPRTPGRRVPIGSKNPTGVTCSTLSGHRGSRPWTPQFGRIPALPWRVSRNGRTLRVADITDRGLGRTNWADSGPSLGDRDAMAGVRKYRPLPGRVLNG